MDPVSVKDMFAARWHGRSDVRVEVVSRPRPAPDQAVVAVELAGLCGSDAEEYLHGPVVARPPVTLGHEIVGRVDEPAADGSGPAAGTRVVVDVVTGCGRCFWCRRHEEGLCPGLVVTGLDADGGLAEFVLGRAERLVPVPDTLDPRIAVLAEPTAVAVRATRKVGSLLGAGVLVVGGGTIGMLTGQLARSSGAGEVVVVEPAAYRRDLLASWGLTAVWHADPAARAASVRAALDDRNADLAFECSGRNGMPAEAIGLVRSGGTAILLGVTPEAEALPTLDVVLGEKTIVGSAAHMWDDDTAVAVGLLASGSIDASAMLTHTFDLANAAEAFQALVDPAVPSIKVAVRI